MHIFRNAPGPEAYYAIKDSFIYMCNELRVVRGVNTHFTEPNTLTVRKGVSNLPRKPAWLRETL